MIYKYKNMGFTLIEISMVLIILGLVAALAFPALFAQIERNKGQEAMHTLNLIKSSIESCGTQNAYNFDFCITWDQIGMDDPSSTNFKYSELATPEKILSSAQVFTQDAYSIQALRNNGSGDTITLTRTAAGVLCAGTGAFNGFC